MDEPQAGKIVVHIERDLEELIPNYLANRRRDLVTIDEALLKGDLETVRVIGHGMKGSGGGYGFAMITEIGRRMEDAAKEGQVALIREEQARLSAFLEQVEVVYD